MSRARLCFALICVSALIGSTPAIAEAPTWTRASMTAATTYFPVGTSAMIVGVGADARPVANTLVEVLQASDTFELVIDARAIGDVGELSDDEIVKRAFARPIKRVAIVRVFRAGSSVKAVVTVYAPQGQVTTAFTLSPSKPLVENPAPEAAVDGVRRDEMQTVQSTAGTPSSADEVTYKREHVVGLSHYGVVSVESVSFYRNGRLITDTPGLYDALGMTARATDHRNTTENHRKWMVRGGVLNLIGLTGVIGFGTWALVKRDTTDYNTGVVTEASRTVPLALTAGSVGLMIIGTYLIRANPRPANLTNDEAVSLIDAHNAKKRRAARVEPTVHFAPTASQSGAGLVVMGSF